MGLLKPVERGSSEHRVTPTGMAARSPLLALAVLNARSTARPGDRLKVESAISWPLDVLVEVSQGEQRTSGYCTVNAVPPVASRPLATIT
jgi:hypothetical protein